METQKHKNRKHEKTGWKAGPTSLVLHFCVFAFLCFGSGCRDLHVHIHLQQPAGQERVLLEDTDRLESRSHTEPVGPFDLLEGRTP